LWRAPAEGKIAQRAGGARNIVMRRPIRFDWRPAAAALALIAAACGQDTEAPQTSQSETAGTPALAVWRHGIVEAKGDASVLYMPAEGGFARRRGIDLKMVQFVSGGTPVRAIMAGELDSFEGSPVVALPAMHQGADIKIVGCHWQVMTYSLFAAKGIRSIADLKGKSIGVSAPGTLPDFFGREALSRAGLKDGDFTLANVGSSPDRFRAVAAGIVAAAGTSSEFEIAAPKVGVSVLLRGPEATPRLVRSCLMTRASIIDERRRDLVNWLAASMEGYAYALKNRDEALTLAKRIAALPPDDQTAAFVYDEALRYSAVTPDLRISVENVQWSDDAMVRHGTLKERADVSRFIDDGPRQEALKLVSAGTVAR
jgi:NitT/TauT family transport system substrate-binding protein